MKKNKVWKTKFRCLKCGVEWQDKPGPTPYIACGHKLVKWLNYEKTYGKLSPEELIAMGGTCQTCYKEDNNCKCT